MRRQLLTLAVAAVLITSAGCSTQTTGAIGASTSSAPNAAMSSPIATSVSVLARPTTVADNDSAAASAAASSTKRVAASSAPPTVAAITAATKPPTAAQMELAKAKYAALAKTAFPDVSTATIVSTAKSLCTALGQGSSLHDEVGQLAGQVRSQTAAEDLVRAAVGAYCPTVTLH